MKVINKLNRAIKKDPTNAEAHCNRGDHYHNSELYEEAIKDYSSAIDFNPSSYRAFQGRGFSFLKIGQNEDAIEDFTKAIIICSNISDTYEKRGYCYYAQKKYLQAINDYSRAIELEPNSPESYHNRGYCYLKLTNYSQAINDFTTSINLKPNSLNCFINRGLCYLSMKQYQKAINDFNKSIELNPDFCGSYANRGLCYKYIGKAQKAITDLNTFFYLYQINALETPFEVDLLTFYEILKTLQDYPLGLQTALSNINFKTNYQSVQIFNSNIKLIFDFNLLFEYHEVQTTEIKEDLSYGAILSYYLGDIVNSFIIFDEKIENGINVLNSQDWYYYVLSAENINREFKYKLDLAVNELIKRPTLLQIDHYYLGHIYILNGDVNNSINHFEKSKEFEYSEIMLKYLIGDKTISCNARKKLNNRLKIEVDFNTTDLEQFNDYFHFQECLIAINHFNTSHDNSNYFEPIWKVFKLHEGDKVDINNTIRKRHATIIIESIKKDFITELEKNYGVRKDEFTDDTIHKLLEYKKKSTELFYYINNGIKEELDIENQIGLVIEEFEYNNPRFYLYIIQFYYYQEKISSKGVFMLTYYLLYISEKKKNIKNKTDIENFLFEAIKTSTVGTGMKLFLTAFKSIFNIINNYYLEYEEFESEEESDYRRFKNDFWKYVNIENNKLSNVFFNGDNSITDFLDKC